MIGTYGQDPQESGARLPRFAKRAQEEAFLDDFNRALLAVSSDVMPTAARAAVLPIIYIVGVPRSGTTLLSQLVSRFLPVGYVNNLIARCWRRPAVGIVLTRALLGERAREGITFHSSYGTTHEVVGPHEFGYFWRQWLSLDAAPNHHLSPDAQQAVDREGLRVALEQEILGVFDSPVVFKNVICGFHAALLTAVHPPSLFIHIVRDPYSAATSILEARMLRYGSYDTWWSLKPSTYPFSHRNDPAAEVAQQVVDCRREFEQELSRPGVQSMTVGYEELCRDPAGVLDRIGQRIVAFGVSCQRVPGDLPALTPTPPSSLPDPLVRRLRECLAQAERP